MRDWENVDPQQRTMVEIVSADINASRTCMRKTTEENFVNNDDEDEGDNSAVKIMQR